MWDLMNPSWWVDKVFDDDHDNDWWYDRYSPYSPYWGAPYRQRPRVIVVLQQPDTKKKLPRPSGMNNPKVASRGQRT
jgi:hypothetical protein